MKDKAAKLLLLIRLDAIGDYILFRNFIEILKKSTQYKNYKITLLGNISWKNIAEELDSKIISEFIWIDVIRFITIPEYHQEQLKIISTQFYDTIISPVYSRYFYIDSIVSHIKSNYKVASIGNFSNISAEHKAIGDKVYSQLIPAKKEIMFEFLRNKEFFEQLLDTTLSIPKPNISLAIKEISLNLPTTKYAILFIGGSEEYRKWKIDGFLKIANFLREQYDFSIVLCGGPDDYDGAEKFSKEYNHKFVNTVGKTTLTDLLYIISNAQLMISNETSAPHFAVALDVKDIFVISNGNHYGRFTPYPNEITDCYHVIYHPEIANNLDNQDKLISLYSSGSQLDINDITYEAVKENIRSIFCLKYSIKADFTNSIQNAFYGKLKYSQLLSLTSKFELENYPIFSIVLYQTWLKYNKTQYNHAIWFNLGILLFKNSQMEEAMVAYKQAIRLSPSFIHPRFNLGIVYEHLGQADKAISQWRWIDDNIKPNQLENKEMLLLALNNLGRIYQLHHQEQTALFYFSKSLSLTPKQSYVHSHVKEIKTNLGIN